MFIRSSIFSSGVPCSGFFQWVKQDGISYGPSRPAGHGFQQAGAWKAYNRAQPGESGIFNMRFV